MTTYVSHSAAQLRRAQLNGAYKTKSQTFGVTVDYKKPIISCLASGPKSTEQVAARLGMSDITVYRRLTAMAELGLIGRVKKKGIRYMVWSLPGATTEAAGASERPRRYVPTFQPAGRSESEFYGHRDVAMVARK